MPDDTLWPLEPSTEAKHRLYKHYLDGWWAVMLQAPWPRVTYVDAFAGPGRYETGEEGSPVFALKRLLNHSAVGRMGLSKDRVRLVFIEKRRDRFEYLCQEVTRKFGDLEALPVRVVLRYGEAAAETQKVLAELGAWGDPILAIFDSWGNVGVPLPLVEKLARNKSSEVIITFGPNWFSRREDLDADQLDIIFGGHQFWQKADRESRTDERWREWLTTYRDALRRVGFPYRFHFQVVPKTGQPLYLVYGTTHPKGVAVMKDAMWKVDREGGMSFRDPRTRGAQLPGQMDLFGGGTGADPELLELVTQRLQEGAVTVHQLREWLLRETARWRERDAKPAVEELVNTGAAVVEPAGRITKESVIRLR